MPLIRAMREFFGRRMAVHDSFGSDGRIQQAGMGAQATGLTWMVIVFVALPLILTLALIGLIYEAIRRLDRGNWLGNRLRWAASGALGIIVAIALAVVLRNWLFTASLT